MGDVVLSSYVRVVDCCTVAKTSISHQFIGSMIKALKPHTPECSKSNQGKDSAIMVINIMKMLAEHSDSKTGMTEYTYPSLPSLRL